MPNVRPASICFGTFSAFYYAPQLSSHLSLMSGAGVRRICINQNAPGMLGIPYSCHAATYLQFLKIIRQQHTDQSLLIHSSGQVRAPASHHVSRYALPLLENSKLPFHLCKERGFGKAASRTMYFIHYLSHLPTQLHIAVSHPQVPRKCMYFV